MITFREISPIIAISLLTLQGCQVGAEDLTPSATVTLQPYETDTSTTTPSPLADQEESDGSDLLPTPTPFLHQVQEGETLLSIALRYGVSLDDLLAANPGLNPRFLSIDQELRIPGPDGQAANSLIPTSTPLPLELSSGACYQSNDEQWWCLAEVENTTENAVEGLTAKVRLKDQQGHTISNTLAYAPLNRMLPGARLPVITSFEGESLNSVQAEFSLLSAVASTEGGSRYLDTSLDIRTKESLDSGGQWRVAGEVSIETQGQDDNFRLSILAMGFNSEDRIVGYSKWEPDIEDDGPWEFELLLFSLGPPIERVDISSEAIILDE